MTVIDEIRHKLETRLGELDAEEEKLRMVISELGGTNSRKPAGRPSGGRSEAPSAPKRTPAKRARKGQRREEFLDYVGKAGPAGITVAAVAKLMGLGSPQPLYAVAKDLEGKGEVKKDGPRYIAPTNAGAMPPKEKPAKPKAAKPAKPKSSKPKPKGKGQKADKGDSKEETKVEGKEEPVAA